jgi:glycosyltransferase involved in cell wall biosynthesis
LPEIYRQVVRRNGAVVLKIAFLLDEICAGSSSVISGEMVRGMRKRGVDIDVVAIVRRPIDDKMKENLGDIEVKYVQDHMPLWFNRLDFKFPGFSFFSLHHLMYSLFAPWILKDYDLIIASCHYTTFLVRPWSVVQKKPYLLMMWSMAEDTARREYGSKIIVWLAKILDWWAIGGAKAILISNHWYKFKKPVYYLYPGCHPIKKLPTKRKPVGFAYDRWDRANDPRKVLRHCRGLITNKWELWFAGYWHDKSLERSFWEEVAKVKYPQSVKWLGALNQKDIYKILSEVTYHVHLPREPFGMQTWEAMACGCGFMCHPESGVMDLIDQKKIAFNKDIFEQSKKNTWEHYCDKLLEAINGVG